MAQLKDDFKTRIVPVLCHAHSSTVSYEKIAASDL